MVCIERLKKYKRLIAPIGYEPSWSEKTCVLTLGPSNQDLVMPSFFVEVEMIFLVYLLRHATKASINPIKVEMQEPIKELPFLEFMGCEVIKGSENRLVFKGEDLERPFVSQNEWMWAFFEPEFQKP